MKIYLARPITGCSFDEVVGYYEKLSKLLNDVGYEVLCPMTGKAYLRNEERFRPQGYQFGASTNHAIVERDRWMVQQSDVVFMDLHRAKHVSIGCMMELAWAHQLGRHTVIATERHNPNNHAFVYEAADIRFFHPRNAVEYLFDLIQGVLR